MSAPQAKLADELLRRLAATIRSSQLYSPGHPIIAKNMDGFRASLQFFHTRDVSVVVGLVGDEIIVDDVPIANADTLGAIVQRLKDAGVVPNARVTVQTTPGGGVTIVIPGHENVTLPHEMAHAVKVEKV